MRTFTSHVKGNIYNKYNNLVIRKNHMGQYVTTTGSTHLVKGSIKNLVCNFAICELLCDLVAYNLIGIQQSTNYCVICYFSCLLCIH